MEKKGKKKIIKEYNATHAERQMLCAEAGRLAVRATIAAGLPLTYAEGTDIIRELNGVKEVIGHVPPKVKVTKRVYKFSDAK